MRGDLAASTVSFNGAGGDEIEGYLVRPEGAELRAAVVVIHHLPGYDAATKEIARRFGVLGYDAVCPNLYSREAPGAEPDDAAATVRAAGGVPDDRLVGDVEAAAAYLTGLEGSTGQVGVIGFCSGGRQAVLAACRLPLQAAVDCYGAYVVGRPPSDSPLQVSPLYDDLPQLSCPLLGLFGSEDKAPSPAQVAELAELLKSHGKEFEFQSYDGAGHAFFAVDRPSYRPAAAVDGWRRIEAFFARHLQ